MFGSYGDDVYVFERGGVKAKRGMVARAARSTCWQSVGIASRWRGRRSIVMGRRKSVAWALLLVVALAGGCGRDVSFNAAEEEGGMQIDWSSVTPAEVEELIAKGELDAKGLYKKEIRGEMFALSTPMMVVLYNGNLNVLDVLIEHGADIEHYSLFEEEGKITALNGAVYMGNVEMVERLLELGVSAEEEYNIFGSPIIYFVLTGNDLNPRKRKEILDLLLQYGANINALDYRSEKDFVVSTPLMVAVMRAVTNRFFSHEEDYHEEDYIELIRYMISRGGDINLHPPGSVVTAMNFAAVGVNANVIEELISLGGDVNLQSDVDCLTPLLTYAAFGQSIEVFDVLIDSGANLDHHTCDGSYDILDILALRRNDESFQLEENPVFGYLKFATEEEWSDFGDRIVGRLSELCEELPYEICHDLEEGT